MAETGQVCILPTKKLMLEYRVFPMISAGMYIISSKKDNKYNGHLLTSLMQVAPDPPKISVSICKEHLTHEFIQESRIFSISILSNESPKKFLADFGFRSGRSYDKFKGINFKLGTTGAPVVLENSLAYLECKVVDSLDSGTYTVFLADVVDSELLKTGKPLTYIFYLEAMRGKTPPTSPAYVCVC